MCTSGLHTITLYTVLSLLHCVYNIVVVLPTRRVFGTNRNLVRTRGVLSTNSESIALLSHKRTCVYVDHKGILSEATNLPPKPPLATFFIRSGFAAIAHHV